MKSKKIFVKYVLVLMLALGALSLHAGDDIALNGDFKGTVSAAGVDNWQLISGKFRRLPTRDHDEFVMELAPGSVMRSKLFPVTGNILKLEAEISGSGMGRFGYAAFDRKGKLIKAYADGASISAVRRRSKVKISLPLAADTAFVAIVLESGKKSTVAFEDVEAEFKGTRVNSSGVVVDGRAVIPLADDGFYKLSDLGALPFGVTLTRGSDIEFELEEKSDDRWEVRLCNRKLCHVKLKHDRDGVWPFVTYKAEIEIEAVAPGVCEIVLLSTSGRRVNVVVTVKARR